MPAESKSKQRKAKDTRVGFDVPAEIRSDFANAKKQLGVSSAKLAELATQFIIPRVKRGELVNLNGELVQNPAA